MVPLKIVSNVSRFKPALNLNRVLADLNRGSNSLNSISDLKYSILNGATSNNVNTFPLNEKKCQHLKNNLKFYNITIYIPIYTPDLVKHHSTKLGGKYWKCFLPFKWMGWWIWGLKEQLANLLDTKICIFEMEKYLLTP